MSDKAEVFQRLVEIREEMAELIGETEDLIRSEFPSDYPNAQSYWIAHIKCALGDMGYPTYSTTFNGFLESNEDEVYADDIEDGDLESDEEYFDDFNSVGSRHHY